MTRHHGTRSAARAAAQAQALGMDLWFLGLESATVIGLRTMKLAMGDSEGHKEAGRMIAEKIVAAAQLPAVLATSGAWTSPESIANSTVRHYARKVRANRRRLMRPSAKTR